MYIVQEFLKLVVVVLEKMLVWELRQALKAHGLNTDGYKSALVNRLIRNIMKLQTKQSVEYPGNKAQHK